MLLKIDIHCTKFQFKGKQVLLSLIELPFAVSPVIAGLVFVLLFTPRGALGEWLLEHGVKLCNKPRGRYPKYRIKRHND